MKRLILLATLMIVTSWTFSQSGYPKWILYESDTVVAITGQQLDKVNEVKIERDACYEAMYVSNETIDSLVYTVEQMEQLSHRQRELTEAKDSIKDSIIEEQTKTNQKLLEANKRWKRGAGLIGLAGLLIGILL